MYLLAIVKGMIITIKHLLQEKLPFNIQQVREMSPVYRGQHQLKRDEQGRKLYRLCMCFVMSAEAITMKAEERKPEKHLYREEKKYASMKSICCVVFCGLCEEVSKRRHPLDTSKH
jgi:NADH-quinone oxidoreductase subunit I